MQTRRELMTSVALAALALPLAGWRAGARRPGGFFLVDGWVLTADDVRALAWEQASSPRRATPPRR
jgi:hypothetical protein